ncbi:alpha/beta fold hydrolase [Peptoniphilus ovalis]|uniref:alpha/beta fold hydrolase n=1 Tax=Peptoniphilus ovalis TaxID=2841503 RepID=UPI0031BA71BE
MLTKYLNKSGYTVFISDNRGHGASIDAKYNHGYIDGVEKVVDDNIAITNCLNEYFPEKEVYMIGHSLGTVFARIFLENSDYKINKLVLSGPPNFIEIVPLAIFIGNIANLYFVEHKTLKILEKLYTGKKLTTIGYHITKKKYKK